MQQTCRHMVGSILFAIKSCDSPLWQGLQVAGQLRATCELHCLKPTAGSHVRHVQVCPALGVRSLYTIVAQPWHFIKSHHHMRCTPVPRLLSMVSAQYVFCLLPC